MAITSDFGWKQSVKFRTASRRLRICELIVSTRAAITGRSAEKNPRKPRGAVGIRVIESDLGDATVDVAHESNGIQSDSEATVAKPVSKRKKNTDQQDTGHFAVSDIKKAAAFAKSIGGLDKAIAVLQILKVAKEVS